jgi:hypothetical protein
MGSEWCYPFDEATGLNSAPWELRRETLDKTRLSLKLISLADLDSRIKNRKDWTMLVVMTIRDNFKRMQTIQPHLEYETNNISDCIYIQKLSSNRDDTHSWNLTAHFTSSEQSLFSSACSTGHFSILSVTFTWSSSLSARVLLNQIHLQW